MTACVNGNIKHAKMTLRRFVKKHAENPKVKVTKIKVFVRSKMKKENVTHPTLLS